jgi:hypothetical protein
MKQMPKKISQNRMATDLNYIFGVDRDLLNSGRICTAADQPVGFNHMEPFDKLGRHDYLPNSSKYELGRCYITQYRKWPR